ncbi:MAG: type III secretion system export apparatus subunit SctT [Hydrogenophaga sp.]
MEAETTTLMGALSELSASFQSIGLMVALCSIRFYAAFYILPPTGDTFLTGLIRTGLVVILGSYLAFGVEPEEVLSMTALDWLYLAVKETLIGLVIGYFASTVFWIAEAVGALIDTQTGYNNVQMTNPMNGEQSTPVSAMLLQLVVSVFYVLGGMTILVGVMFESFKIWPLLSTAPSLAGTAEVFVIQQTDSLMAGIVKFSAPALLILVLIDLGFGLIARSADKLEPTSLAQPVKGAVSMLMLALLVGVFLDQVRRYLLPHDLLQRLQQMGGG